MVKACRRASPTLTLALLMLCAGVAHAQQEAPNNDPDEVEARSLFQAGQVAFGAARYDDALRYFRDAHRLSGRAALLYNIGVAADRLRRDQEALEAFERFLAEAPADMPQRADAAARVRVLRESIANEGAAPAPSEEADTAERPSAETDRSMDALPGWILAGVGAAGVVAGAVLVGVGQSDADLVMGSPAGTPWSDVAEEGERADLLRNLGWVMLGAGAAIAAAGLGWALAVGGESGGATARLEIVPGGVRVRGAF